MADIWKDFKFRSKFCGLEVENLNFCIFLFTWDDLSYSGSRSEQQYIEAGRSSKTPDLNTDVGSRIGIILKPQKENLSFANLHVVINGRDQGPVRTNIKIDDLQKNSEKFVQNWCVIYLKSFLLSFSWTWWKCSNIIFFFICLVTFGSFRLQAPDKFWLFD